MECCCAARCNENENTTMAVKSSSSRKFRKRSHLVLSTVKLVHHRKKRQICLQNGKQQLLAVRECTGLLFASFAQYNQTIRVGQNRIYTPYMTVCMVISLLKIPYVICIVYV